MPHALRDAAAVREFHAHVYYTAGTRAAAAALREALERLAGGRLTIYTLSDGPRGPHVAPMFGVDIPRADLAEVLAYLMLNHGGLSVLVHPVTENEVLDHSHHALWLGQPQPLDLSVLA
jgi:DOPA 4,5-dioxygenase